MGYGVVKMSLGRTMVYVRWLAITHFVFGLIYAITSLVVSPETAGKLYSSSASLLSFFLSFSQPSIMAHKLRPRAARFTRCLPARQHSDSLLCLDT